MMSLADVNISWRDSRVRFARYLRMKGEGKEREEKGWREERGREEKKGDRKKG